MFGFKKRQPETGRDDEQAPSSNQRADELWAQGSKLLEKRKVGPAIEAMEAAYLIEPSRLEGRLNLGAALYLAKRFDEAETHLRYVLAFDPQNSMALLNLAATYDAMDRLDDSVLVLEKLVAERPNWKDAHYNLAIAYFKQKSYEKATEALRAEMKLNPEHEAARALLNKIYLMPTHRP